MKDRNSHKSSLDRKPREGMLTRRQVITFYWLCGALTLLVLFSAIYYYCVTP